MVKWRCVCRDEVQLLMDCDPRVVVVKEEMQIKDLGNGHGVDGVSDIVEI